MSRQIDRSRKLIIADKAFKPIAMKKGRYKGWLSGPKSFTLTSHTDLDL